MPTEFWYPISGATHDLDFDAWSDAGPTNKNASTRPGGGRSGPMTHDDETSYVFSAAVASQALNVSWPSPMSAYSGSLTASFRHHSRFGGSNRRLFMQKTAPPQTNQAVYDITNSNATWISEPLKNISNGTLYRPGGGSWVLADFVGETETFALVSNLTGTGDGAVTSVWGQIAFAGTGGFVFLLGLAGMSALPIAGALDFGHFSRFVSWRRTHHPRGTVFRDRDEVLEAWREVRAYRHPRFFLWPARSFPWRLNGARLALHGDRHEGSSAHADRRHSMGRR